MCSLPLRSLMFCFSQTVGNGQKWAVTLECALSIRVPGISWVGVRSEKASEPRLCLDLLVEERQWECPGQGVPQMDISQPLCEA